METIETITMKINLVDKSGKLIPKGVTETLNVEIQDEAYFWWFKDAKTTKLWASKEIEIDKMKGKANTAFFAKEQKAGTIMKGMKKEEIKEKIIKTLEEKGIKKGELNVKSR